MIQDDLIIDDAAAMRKIIMRGAQQAGLELADAHPMNGDAADAASPSGLIDLILFDVRPHDENGKPKTGSFAPESIHEVTGPLLQ